MVGYASMLHVNTQVARSGRPSCVVEEVTEAEGPAGLCSGRPHTGAALSPKAGTLRKPHPRAQQLPGSKEAANEVVASTGQAPVGHLIGQQNLMHILQCSGAYTLACQQYWTKARGERNAGISMR